MEGQEITVWFADEPINVLEGVNVSIPRFEDKK
jgi:hypothetical protein